MSRKGFTLIELLVVISIIALLSSIILSSLNSARGKAADGAVRAALRQIGTQVELYANSNDDIGFSVYSAACNGLGAGNGVFSDAKVQEILDDMVLKLRTGGTVECATNADGNKFAVKVSALRGSGTTWCIDNNRWFGPGNVNATNGECE